MATAINTPLLRMEDRVRDIRRMAEQFTAGITTPDRTDGHVTRAAFSPRDYKVAGRKLIGSVIGVFDSIEDLFDAVGGHSSATATDPRCAALAECPAVVSTLWDFYCFLLGDLSAAAAEVRSATGGVAPGYKRSLLAELDDMTDRLCDLMRYAVVAHPEWKLTVPDHLAATVWAVRVPPLAYLRAMATLFWSSIRHPLSDTTIDLSTGRVLCRT